MLRSSFWVVVVAIASPYAAVAQSQAGLSATPATAPASGQVQTDTSAAAANTASPRCAQLQAEMDALQRKMLQSSNETSRLALNLQKDMRRNAKRTRATGALSRLAGLIPGAGAVVGMGSSLLGAGIASPRLDPAMDGRIEEQVALSERMLEISNGLIADRCPPAMPPYGALSPPDPAREAPAADPDPSASAGGD